MLGQIFSAIGGAIGNAFGGGILSSVGRFAGRMLGSYVESDKTNNTEQFQPREYYSLKNLKESFNVTRAIYGHPIALIFGSMKQDGKIIWASKIKELRNTQSEQQYFRDYSNIRSIRHTTLCEYYLSFAVALCEGEILEVARVWANDNIINLDDYKFRLYKGSEDQMPDPLIIANCLPGQAPAYRGLAYIVFEDLPLSDFDQNVPVFSFEIIRKANIANTNCVEDIVKSMVIIPGSGEYVYDTKIQYKFSKNQAGKDTAKNVINSHNYSDLADSVHSLNQLLQICENIEWVSPVVCWFGDSTNVSLCKIKPAVEFNDSNITYSEEWKVGYYRRSSAKLISRDIEGNPKYGGSVNDDSILRYLEELKSRNLKIMFYPMCFLDVEGKPWRGHLTGSAEHIENFFNKDEGYNNFIIHYANLVKNHVDAFVIGSELIGLTAVRRGSQYPAVDELVKLAATVKGIMGPQVLITYAADWSEYHHTSGGWYNLDPLWSSPNIDFIGIDAYFPVTRSTTSMILTSDIEKGWKTGEGYDYYYDQAGIKRPLEAPYAWKNLEYWWENFHQNPDGNNSAWQPRMKKIWFTEFGFPSIDKATNQPNVFFDSYCVDGGMPKYSTGEIDFSIQRKAIKAFMNYWESQEYIERTFLWTWDARPYPAWPHMNIWRDGYLWEKGHWVNNKFGAANIAAIILELSNRCKINQANVDVNDLDDSIEGISFNKSMSANDAINILRISNFFDIKTTQGNKIAFIKRGLRRPCSVTSDILTKIRDNSYVERINISRKNIISKVHINYINRSDNYKKEYCQVDNENFSNKSSGKINLPISFSNSEVRRLGKLILNNALIEDKIIKFEVPASYHALEPTDLINLEYRNYKYQIRLVTIETCNLSLKITGIVDDFESYYLPSIRNKDVPIFHETSQIKLRVLELPFIFYDDENNQLSIYAYLQDNAPKKLYASINYRTHETPTYNKIADLRPGAVMGELIKLEHSAQPSTLLIDAKSIIIVCCKDLDKFIINGWNLALLGKEAVRFRAVKSLGDDNYQLLNIIRGVGATEQYINTHHSNEDFILLEAKPNRIGISRRLEGHSIDFRVDRNKQGTVLNFQNLSKYLPPVFIRKCLIIGNNIEINWQTRENNYDSWSEDISNNNYNYIINLYSNDKSHILNSTKQELNIKVQDLGISGDVDICIIAERSDGVTSIPTKNTVKINL